MALHGHTDEEKERIRAIRKKQREAGGRGIGQKKRAGVEAHGSFGGGKKFKKQKYVSISSRSPYEAKSYTDTKKSLGEELREEIAAGKRVTPKVYEKAIGKKGYKRLKGSGQLQVQTRMVTKDKYKSDKMASAKIRKKKNYL